MITVTVDVVLIPLMGIANVVYMCSNQLGYYVISHVDVVLLCLHADHTYWYIDNADGLGSLNLILCVLLLGLVI